MLSYWAHFHTCMLVSFAGLPWAFPAWVGNGKNWPYDYPDITAAYVVNWILGAKQYHDLDIQYVGVCTQSQYFKMSKLFLFMPCHKDEFSEAIREVIKM